MIFNIYFQYILAVENRLHISVYGLLPPCEGNPHQGPVNTTLLIVQNGLYFLWVVHGLVDGPPTFINKCSSFADNWSVF